MSYTVKAYKDMQTMDGVAFTCNLYKGTRKVGSVENRGDGGPTAVWWDDTASRETESAEFTTWVAQTYPDHDLLEYGLSDEIAADVLVEVCEFNRMSKKRVVIDVSKPGPNGFRLRDVRTVEILDPSRRGEIISAIANRYPGCSVWVPDAGSWLPVAQA